MSVHEKTCYQNVCLIPPRGKLEQLAPDVERIMSSTETPKWVKQIRLPSPKAKFHFKLYVDDYCEPCEYAIKYYAMLARAYPENFHVDIYNISYVKPDRRINATPTTIINEVLGFEGIPIFEEHLPGFLNPRLRKAYIKSHPKAKELLQRLEEFAKAHGYLRNPYDPAFENLIAKLLRNIDLYGHPFCPCRPLNVPPNATPELVYRLNRDKICPCVYVHDDIKRRGHCLCGLFWSKEAHERWLKQRIEKLAPALSEVRSVKKMLENIEVLMIRGSARDTLESIINRLQAVLALYDGE